MKFFRKCQIIFIFTGLGFSLSAQTKNLKVLPENLVIRESKNHDGFDLYIKKTGDINSVLLTESVKDPEGKNDSYAYRATEYNKINGDEIRYLNGQELNSKWAKYSLVDSTVEKTEFFEEAFHIFIPMELVFGYSWSRHGQIELGNNTFINIRAFEKKYADHSGAFSDNPYYLNFQLKDKSKAKKEAVKKDFDFSSETESDIYNKSAREKLSEISDEMIVSKGAENLVSDIKNLLETYGKDNLDVVFAIDGTASMENDLTALKKELISSLQKEFSGKNIRFGLLYYRDYGDYVSNPYGNLPVHIFGFEKDFIGFQKDLTSITPYGGGDIPEPVYEALFAAVEGFSWRENCEKRIILIGDAQPHSESGENGLYTKDFAIKKAAEKGIKITAILLPQ